VARFMATAEGRGKATSRLGSESFGATGTAGTWSVRGEARAFMGPAPGQGTGGDHVESLRLVLQALRDSGGKAHGGVQPSGYALTVWDGTEREALAMTGAHGPHAAVAARLVAAVRLLTEALNAAGPSYPALPRLAQAKRTALAALADLDALGNVIDKAAAKAAKGAT
jgi:hypothetical protein